MKKTSIFFILLTCLSIPAHAIELTGDAYAPSREEAKKQALASLSESLLVEMKSEFNSEQHSDGYKDASKKVSAISELPLLGVDYTVIDKKSEFFCTVFMNSKKSLNLYQSKLNDFSKAIKALNKKQLSQKKNKTERYKTLNELLTVAKKFDKHKTVAGLLGSNKSPATAITISSIKSELLSIEAAVPSLEIAATILTRDLPGHVYFVQPPLPQESKQATKLSRLIRNKILTKVKSTENRGKSMYSLKGSYEVLKDGISVTYHAINSQGLTIASRIVKLAPKAYRNIAYKPKAIDFDKLLHHGYIVSNKFRAEINSNKGNRDLLFTIGETIHLFVKMNHPGYFYIVSHNKTDNISYLLDLNDSQGNRKFLQYINADDANRWMDLGEFEVVPPYGSESLQLISSDKDLIKSLPDVAYDKKLDLYIVQSSSIKEAVMKTRGLKRKKKSKGKAKVSEATLTYTTM
jgi:hypothetical protein